MKTVVVRKIGNSLGVILPKNYLDTLGVQRGDELDIALSVSARGAGIALTKIETIT